MQERETFNNHTVYSLSDVAMSIHRVIERTYTRPYYIKAEILKLNYYPYSGHCYPELVEREGNTIKTEMRAVIWSANFQDINRRFTHDIEMNNLGLLGISLDISCNSVAETHSNRDKHITLLFLQVDSIIAVHT